MSDSEFLDLGDELVVRVSGFPVGRAKIVAIEEDHAKAVFLAPPSAITFELPLDVKAHDTIDGYGHGAAPLTGIPEAETEPCDLCGAPVAKNDKGAFRSDVPFCPKCSDGFAT